jgi:predicted PurR-regulated permease PerM
MQSTQPFHLSKAQSSGGVIMHLAKLLLYLLLLVVFVAGLYFYSWVILYIIGAIVFAYILNPWISWLERRHIPRLAGIFIVYIFIGVLISWGIMRVFPLIIMQAQNLMNFIKGASVQGDVTLLKVPFVVNLMARVDYLDTQVPFLKLHEHFIKVVTQINEEMINIPNLLVKNYDKILEALSLIATIPLIGFFLLKDNSKFRKDFFRFIPNRYFEIAIILLHKVDEIVGKYMRAMFYEVIIVGSLAAIVLTILGVDYAFLIGFLAGLANIIPYFGPVMGVLFAIVSILIAGNPLITILYVIIAMYLIQVLDNNIVYPIVVGTSINMHPLIVFLTVLAGGWSGGIVGMLVSVPIVYLVYNLTKVLYVNFKEYKML